MTNEESVGQTAHFEQMTMVCGYDHNYVSDAKPGKLEKIAVLSDAKAGRTMEVYTDMPGIQVYTGNHIGRHLGKALALPLPISYAKGRLASNEKRFNVRL